MTDVERIRDLCKSKNIPISKVEKDLGYANGFLNPKKVKVITTDRLVAIAKYLNVTVSEILGIEDEKKANKIAFNSREANEASAKFSKLNEQGRQMALDYMDFLMEKYHATIEDEDMGVIRRYLHAPAAGYSSPVLDTDYVEEKRTKDTPKEADYCINVSGDSMEPYIQDGQTVYVQRTTILEDGDVGIWYWQGDIYCKQAAEDAFGNIHLLSANPNREDANIFVRRIDVDQLTCLGKVILPTRLPMPHYN